MPQSIENALSAAAVLVFDLLFRKTSGRDESFGEREKDLAKDKFEKIRCPVCKWSPTRSSRWDCWDCDYPEYFYDGCGTEWNTFETRGICPTCGYQWKWTSCQQCFGWSKHEDWYARPNE